MKKFAIFTLALSLAASMLVGCGCMNTDERVPTLPTNGETATPSTQVTTAPTTMPTTAVTTEPVTHAPTDTTGTLEGAVDDMLGQTTGEAATENSGTDVSRNRGRRMPMP